MFKPAPRSLLRYSIPTIRAARPKRLFSTAPPAQRSRSWKNSAARWCIALGGIYYYNTASVFAEEPPLPLPPSSPSDETSIPTLESIADARRSKSLSQSENTVPMSSLPDSEYLDETEEDASQQGAFNEETGEINWDCPCLGGMANGTCGEQFRAAFSCFVFSKAEPKGMDCIENFKTMQECFRQHPDEYGGEFEDNEPPDDDINPNPNPPTTQTPQVDEQSIPLALPPSHVTPAVNEPSIPLIPSNPSPKHPHVNEPSIDPPAAAPAPAPSTRIEDSNTKQTEDSDTRGIDNSRAHTAPAREPAERGGWKGVGA